MPRRFMDILLVDDSRADRRFITRELAKTDQGFHVDIADTVAGARQKLASKHYDCLLLDYSLPDSDGLALMEGMVKDKSDSFTGVVMITGEGNEKVAARAIQLGAHEYLTKSQIDGPRLVRALDRAIEHSAEKRTRTHQRLVMENFASSAAHDLANPLSGVIGFLTLAQNGITSGDMEKVPAHLENAMTSALYMKQLVADLLHYARTGTTADTPESVGLGEVVDVVRNLLDKTIQREGALIKADNLPTIEAYRTEITQLFQNLISNAIKYRGDDAPEITISAEEREEYCVISVADNGCGVPDNARDAIFTPLHRVHHRGTEGSGLGLAICMKIVDLHRGKIWCEARPGGGSIFRILVARKLDHAANENPAPARAGSRAGSTSFQGLDGPADNS